MSQAQRERLPTGVPGLDEVLHGGLLPQRAYLVRGGPGSGKTILGLHFLSAAAAQGRPALFISLSEPEPEVRANAAALGFDLSGVHFLDLSPGSAFFTEVQSYDIFSPAEVEREPTTRRIVETVERLQPARVFIDAVTQFRYLATDEQQFRKQVLSLLRFLVEQGATVLFTSESSPHALDDDLQFISDGIVELGATVQGRYLSVTKFRGSDFEPGAHALALTASGMKVFPRLVPEAHRRGFREESVPSGVAALDALLHGGLERGTVTLISGPVGAGKTTLGLQFAKEAARRGERSVIYLFEEGAETLLHRSAATGTPVYDMLEAGTLEISMVEPLRMSASEFASQVRHEVEGRGARIVMIDSVAGYRLALRGEDLNTHLHALTRYLKNMGVTTVLVYEAENITGNFRATEVGISYMADNVVFLRYLEMQGELRKAIGVLKKRASDFEKTLRELEITREGIRLGAPLSNLRGVLSGVPEWVRTDGAPARSGAPGEGKDSR